jgi:cobalt/nickel transport system permease protein
LSLYAVLSDRHVAGESFLHGLDARAKLVMTLAFIFAAVLTPDGRWEVFAGLGALLACAIALSGLSPRLVIGRSLLALPFLLAAVPVLFNRPGEAVLEVPVFGWAATEAGIIDFSSILLRSWLSVIAATILTATTEADHILRSLRFLGVPRILVSTISFMWRYVFVIVDEAQRLMRAREARSARAPGSTGGSLVWRARVAGNMVGSLFLRSLSRSERVYVAMLARGYNGELRSLEPFQLRSQDVAAAGVTFVALALLQIYARF